MTAERFQAMYPKFADFCQIRQQLDPKGVFMNDYTKRVLVGGPNKTIPHKYINAAQF